MKKLLLPICVALLLIVTTAWITSMVYQKPKVKPDTILKAQFKDAEWEYYLNQIAVQTNKLAIKKDSIDLKKDSAIRKGAVDTVAMVLQVISRNITDQKINNFDFGK